MAINSRVPLVWIVEDDPVMLEMLVGGFEEEGFYVKTAESAEDADIEELCGADVLILDIVLSNPLNGGLNLLKDVRQRSNIPIILQSSKSEDIDQILGLEMGADDYLTKPYNFRNLLARTKNILRRVKNCKQCDPLYKISNGYDLSEHIYQKLEKPLTFRQKDVLKLIIEGKSNKEIAEEIGVSIHTVKSHVSSILSLLGLPSRSKIAQYLKSI